MKALVIVCMTILGTASAAFAQRNETRGQRVFGACAPCHSLEPNENMRVQAYQAYGVAEREKPGELQPLLAICSRF
jgi:cytochrome c2